MQKTTVTIVMCMLKFICMLYIHLESKGTYCSMNGNLEDKHIEINQKTFHVLLCELYRRGKGWLFEH